MQSKEQPGREHEILRAALAIGSPQERQGYIKGACGMDSALLARVEELLRANNEPTAAAALTEEAAAGPNKTIRIVEPPPAEAPDTIIGRYKILQQIGEGGCGVVYMAEQQQPVRRRVALKVIKLGMDTKSVIARFEAERQALALMDHPNIAKVLDAGATDTGRPYFVMELVRGVKITEYCDEAKLPTRERLQLFIQACHAIQHAHQKGIIHRDLKPSNILVTINDGVPVPKVIDFGIAKATTDQRLTDKTLFTAYEQFIGTPAYMSPEQAVMTSLDIDTRSDIYALGVLLYELLTGKTPFDQKELLQSGFDEMRRTIREQEPERPSTRLSTMLDADRTSLARSRQCDAPALIHLLRGDLDWIVMKALEKDRTRRYETANGLGMDIQRHMDNEPVIARPPSNLYRFQKLVRRNKTLVGAVAAVCAALVFGLGLSLYLFVQERQARRRAEAAEREQGRLRQKAEQTAELETQLRKGAERGQKYTQAGNLLSERKFEECEKLLRELPLHPAVAPMFVQLGVVRGMREQWEAAITNLTTAADLAPSNHLAFHYLAPLLLHTGKIEDYQRLRQRILLNFTQTADPLTAERMAKACMVFLPLSTPELADAVKLSKTAYDAGPKNEAWPYFQFVRGLAAFREAQFSDSVSILREVVSHRGNQYRTMQAGSVLAMSYHRLGQMDLAKGALAEVERADAELPKPGNIGETWNEWIIAKLLLREARGEMGAVQ